MCMRYINCFETVPMVAAGLEHESKRSEGRATFFLTFPSGSLFSRAVAATETLLSLRLKQCCP